MSKPWSKLRSRIEALWDPRLTMAIHSNVFRHRTKAFVFDEPRHWIVLDHRIIWDFPVPFMQPNPRRGRELGYWESGYGWDGRRPSEPSCLLRDYLDRPRVDLMVPIDDPWELAAILRAADQRLGRETLLPWATDLDDKHPAWQVLSARFGTAAEKLRPILP